MHNSSNKTLSRLTRHLSKKSKQYWPIFQCAKNTTTIHLNSDDNHRHNDILITNRNAQNIPSNLQREIEEEWQEHIEDCSYWYTKHALYSSNTAPCATTTTTTTTHRNFKQQQSNFSNPPHHSGFAPNQKITLSTLPTELLCDIFSYLTYTQLTTTLRTVTRRFNTIICDPCNCIISMRRSKLLPKCTPQAPTKFWQIWRERMYTQQRKSMIYSSTRGSRDWGLDIMRDVKYRYTIHHGLNNLMVDVGVLERRNVSVKDVIYLKRCSDDRMAMVPCPGFWYGENACEPPRGVVKVIPTLEGQEYGRRCKYIARKDEMGLDVRGIVESLLHILNREKDEVLKSLERKKSRRLGKVTRYRMLLGDLFDYEVDEVDRYSLLCEAKGEEWFDRGVSLCDGNVRLIEG